LLKSDNEGMEHGHVTSRITTEYEYEQATGRKKAGNEQRYCIYSRGCSLRAAERPKSHLHP
jgi:hypothetical protein